MRINHTPMGFLKSKKKYIAGAAALALVGGIAPTLISKTYAETSYSADDVIFTTVGPYYFTNSGLDLDAISSDGATVTIADTDVADFYGYEEPEMTLMSAKSATAMDTVTLDLDSMKSESYRGTDAYDGPIYRGDCDRKYACIQGKEIGETEIIISRDGEEDIRIPLKSVELTPKAYNIAVAGRTVSGTGSLNGADDSFLKIRESYKSEGVAVSLKGERGYSIISSNDGSSSDYGAELIWTIGNQTVGGGTDFSFMPFEAADLIFGNEDNEEMLKDATALVFDTIYDDEDYYESMSDGRDVLGIKLSDGSIANLYAPERTASKAISRSTPRSGFITELAAGDSEINKTTETKLVNKMPKNAQVVDYKEIHADIYRYYIWSSSPAYISVDTMKVRATGLGGSPEIADDESVDKVKIGDFVKFGKAIAFSFEAPETEPVEAGKTRKWYATYMDGGSAKRIDVIYDAKNNTLNFASNVLGDYAFGYVDETDRSFVPEVPNTGTAPVPKIISTAVVTFVPLMTFAGAAFVIRTVKRKTSHKLAKKFKYFE